MASGINNQTPFGALSTLMEEPTSITLGLTLIALKLKKTPDEDDYQLYHRVKEKFQSFEGFNIQCNDKACTIRILHHEHVIQCAIRYLELNDSLREEAVTLLKPNQKLSFYGGNSFMVTGGHEAAVNKKAALLELAANFYQTSPDRHVTLDFPGGCSVGKLIPRLLKEYNGVCLGELHSEDVSKRLIVHNIKTLKDLGLETLYLEHVFYDTMAEQLSDPERKLPFFIQKYLAFLDRKHKVESEQYNFSTLVMKARENKLRIVPIDTTLSYLCGAHRKNGVHDFKERLEGMNYVASCIIAKDQKDHPGKYIALVGSGHVAKARGIPGIGNLLGIPSVVIEEGEQTSLQLNKKPLHKEIEEVSAYITVGRNNRKRVRDYSSSEVEGHSVGKRTKL